MQQSFPYAEHICVHEGEARSRLSLQARPAKRRGVFGYCGDGGERRRGETSLFLDERERGRTDSQHCAVSRERNPQVIHSVVKKYLTIDNGEVDTGLQDGE
jgi:hypothetical protein